MISNQELLCLGRLMSCLHLCLLPFALWGWGSCDNQDSSRAKALLCQKPAR